MTTCTHRDMIHLPKPAEGAKAGAVCPACIEAGTEWVHLRQCMTCGAVGCCDSSPERHARHHAEGEDHPIVTSMEPGETWVYCFEDDTLVRLAARG
ncbi:UBP-type zinc finger domain-containing protein [Roseobacter sp. HKCCA0434]|uniref:UBP-type zinc finger domain-containing protein n=1 Tax=Roseobacter sp. HKCCA0434 TaxID=3079297 RepID=UPI0029058107|nr:UBP-type zinc finger domain-containing protein [Roseobacter sp. HKCCA0434]